MPKFSGRGGEVHWRKGVKGTWLLRERFKGSSAIIGRVVPVGREYRALDWSGIDRGVFRSVSPAKEVVERMAKVSERQ
ncbi:hypothetical protein LCGC14_1118440 [marine sediment metagenome]|uniref:Uncharacterized protein n=1 Tax=marine sediment metagenome TaxID=412755 RepID=A0A0F9M4P0_9ZZZZ